MIILEGKDHDRFWSKVDRRGPEDCWPWLAGLNNGYGRFSLRGKGQLAHRIAYATEVKQIRAGERVWHGCDLEICCNPKHLYLASDAERIIERFWSKVDRGDADSCWLWTAAAHEFGYGKFSLVGSEIGAHRFAWTITNGRIPEGQQVCHSCDTPACVRPEHLFLGTAADNVADMVQKGRNALGENNGNSRLSDEQADEVFERYMAGGISQPELAKQYGVSQAAIWYTIHRRKK